MIQLSDSAPSSSPRRRGRPAGSVPWLTFREVADLWNVSLPTVYKWADLVDDTGKPVVPTVRLHRRRGRRMLQTVAARLPNYLPAAASLPDPFFSRFKGGAVDE